MAKSQLNPAGTRSTSDSKAVVIGLYGLPGSGKTYLLNQLKTELRQTDFTFYEGSQMIAALVPGGLDAFQSMGEDDKRQWRKKAIDAIGKNCTGSGQVAVVAGHFMFWLDAQEATVPVYTENDLEVFTHIFYLEVPSEVVAQRRLDDTDKIRPSISESHLQKWQQEEKTQLRDLCRSHDILFSLVSPCPSLLNKVSKMLQDFSRHTEEHNLTQAKIRLDDVLGTSQGHMKTVLFLDADKTLAAEDTGALFWKEISYLGSLEHGASTLNALFGGPLGHSYTAFRQAMLLYEEAVDDQEFDSLCNEVALEVTMHPEFVSLLQFVTEQKHVGAVVVTSGLRHVWEKVLKKECISEKVKVIGGGRIEDGFVVTAAVKGAMVAHLQEAHRLCVWAFGDSPLDLDMLRKADHAIIVVGEEETRSKGMDAALTDAIDDHGLHARQAVLPSNATPRLNDIKLPLIELGDPNFVDALMDGQHTRGGLRVVCATDRSASKLLATRMRDAAVAGPSLRKVHHRVGWYLANEFVADVVGLEQCPIQHVLLKKVEGFRLFHEHQTTIVALMRGGEPMALGVSDAFPLAMFVHAKDAEDLKLHHLQGQLTVILVDSVVNTGKTIIEFAQQVRKLHATIRIVVVTGVIQADCITEGSSLNNALAHYANLHLVALRYSKTKFTGSGTTDTGNRLFNTTHLA